MSSIKLLYNGYYFANGFAHDPAPEGFQRAFCLIFREDGIVKDFGSSFVGYVDMDEVGLELELEMNRFYCEERSKIQLGYSVGEYSTKVLNGKLLVEVIFPKPDFLWNNVGLGQLCYTSLSFEVHEDCLMDGVYRIFTLVERSMGDYKQKDYWYFFEIACWKKSIF